MKSPAEFYIRFILSPERPPTHLNDERQEQLRMFTVRETCKHLDGMHILYPSTHYVLNIWEEMETGWPQPYNPENPFHRPSREFLKTHRIYDLWHPTRAVKQALLVAQDISLRERLEPLMLSSMKPEAIVRRLHSFAAMHLTVECLSCYKHYFWNRDLLSQDQWVSLLERRRNSPQYVQSLLNPPDLQEHLPWLVGVSGPNAFNAAEAAQRISQIAYKHAMQIEHKEATIETTTALRNCVTTIDRADQILRRSEVALRDVLKQFEKFKMRQDATTVIDIDNLTLGKHSGLLEEPKEEAEDDTDGV